MGNDGASTRLAPPKLPARSVSPVLALNSLQKVSSKTWHVPTNGILEKYGLSSTSSPKSKYKFASKFLGFRVLVLRLLKFSNSRFVSKDCVFLMQVI